VAEYEDRMVKLERIRNAQPDPGQRDSAVDAISRRILCVFPRYTKSFGTFDNAYPLLGVKAFMPPQGLLLIAAYIPSHWEVRFIDENVRPAVNAISAGPMRCWSAGCTFSGSRSMTSTAGRTPWAG
jgi:hypothetical protein